VSEKKKRFRGVHSYLMNGTYFLYVYDRNEPHKLLVELQITGRKIKVLAGEVEK
jgi:hypothetical protein